MRGSLREGEEIGGRPGSVVAGKLALGQLWRVR